LDEAKDREGLSDLIHAVAVDAGKNTSILVTCRRAVYTNDLLYGFYAVELRPLKPEQIEFYVRERLSKEKARKFLKVLQDDSRTMALAGSGFLLAMMTYLFDQGTLVPPISRDELYKQSVEYLLARPRNPEQRRSPTFR